MSLQKLKSNYRHNTSTLKDQTLSELSGALGDLGTFLPIVIALTEGHQISLSTTLILTGVYNIATGYLFGIPLPVQPMKAIAAVAILKSLSAGEVAAAGIFVSACILLLTVTGLLEWITRVVPIPVVKGIQVGAGLSLIIAAGSKATSSLSWTGPSWADNKIWIVVAFLGLFMLNVRPRTPYALIIFAVGLVFAIIRLAGSGSHDHLPGVKGWQPYVLVPRWQEWKVGIVDAGIGQLPLTTLNSIIAVTHLAADLLPELPTPSVTLIGLSVAAMNLFGCWFGAMPVCHGSGGLAAQFRFGARSGASIICLGSIKLVVGLVFGESLADLLKRFPTALLTVVIIAAGLELASVGETLNNPIKARDLRPERRGMSAGALGESEGQERWLVMMVTAGTLVAFKNDAVGFVAGMCCHWSYRYLHRYDGHGGSEVDESQQPLLP